MIRRLDPRSGGRPLGFLVLVGAIAVWEAWARSRPSFLLPPATTTAERVLDVWPSRDFLGDVAVSLARLGCGFALGALAGVATGVAVGSSAALRRTLEPSIELLRAMPPVALVPAAIVLFGLGEAMRISLIAFAVFFPVLVSAADGVRAIPPEARDTAALAQLGAAERVRLLLLPAALPWVFTGLRIALPVALIMVVVAEYVGAQDGLGHYILYHQRLFDIPEMYAGILMLGLLGYALNAAHAAVEARVLAWHHGAAGHDAR